MRLLRAEDDIRPMLNYGITYAKALEDVKRYPYVKIDNCYYISDVNYNRFVKHEPIEIDEDMDEELSTKRFANETGLKYRTALATIRALPHIAKGKSFYIKRQTMYDFFAADKPIEIKTGRPKKDSG